MTSAAHLRFRRGQAYVRRGEFGRAVAAFTQAIDRDPERVDYYFERGNCHAAAGDHSAAAADFSEVIRRQPDHAPAHHNRATAYYDLGQFDKAITDYKTFNEKADDYNTERPAMTSWRITSWSPATRTRSTAAESPWRGPGTPRPRSPISPRPSTSTPITRECTSTGPMPCPSWTGTTTRPPTTPAPSS